MPFFSPESLDELRRKIDLLEVLQPHLALKKSGAQYRGLCPFHEEKSPSFTVQVGSNHYHCFGCGAHGDAIAFLTQHLGLRFPEAVQQLADRYGVHLEAKDSEQNDLLRHQQLQLKEVMRKGCRLYHYFLLESEEAAAARDYLQGRGIDLPFIKKFGIGYAPATSLLELFREQGLSEEQLLAVGLLRRSESGRLWNPFSERITFPIWDATGNPIAISARRFLETTFGGKYINSTETPLFKKSRTLFGLHLARQRIAKHQQVILVEGQLDALRLIDKGFTATVAPLGTAFGEEHVTMLARYGLKKAWIAFDGDSAGKKAAFKAGNLFQKQGVDVFVVAIPEGSDPDTIVYKEGAESFAERVRTAEDYVTFLVRWFVEQHGSTAAGKQQTVNALVALINDWQQPTLVYASLRQVERLLSLPAGQLGGGEPYTPNLYMRKQGLLGTAPEVNGDRILESDFLRSCLTLCHSSPQAMQWICKNLSEADFIDPACRDCFSAIIKLWREHAAYDLLGLAATSSPAGQELISELLQRPMKLDSAAECCFHTIQKLATRNWMRDRQALQEQLSAPALSEEREEELLRRFSELAKHPPKVSSDEFPLPPPKKSLREQLLSFH